MDRSVFPNQEGDEEGDEDEVVEEAPPEEEEEVPLVLRDEAVNN